MPEAASHEPRSLIDILDDYDDVVAAEPDPVRRAERLRTDLADDIATLQQAFDDTLLAYEQEPDNEELGRHLQRIQEALSDAQADKVMQRPELPTDNLE